MNAIRIPQMLGRSRTRPNAVSGDKGYSYPAVRKWLRDHKIKDVIPTRSNQPRRLGFDKAMYRKRNIIERCIGWLKECRRIATRYEKLAVHYMGMLKLAMIRKYLRYDLSDRP